MNKKLGLKVLLKNPFAVIMEGIRGREQNYYQDSVKSTYNIERLPTINILDLIPDLDDTIDSYSYLTGTSLVTDLLLLKSMAKRFDNCAYIEIGSWRGESLANVGSVTTDLTSITLSAEDMKKLGYDDSFVKVHGIFSKDLEINKIECDSHTFDFNTLEKKFDLMFVDGDHSYEGVLNDSKKIFPQRKNEESIIVWHDYSFYTEDVRYSTLKAILDGVPKEFHKNLYHVSNTMCAIYIENWTGKTYKTKFPTYPDKKFTLNIKGEKMKS